ncbi:MAG: hypothetical protein ACI8TP_002782 [Acidimicrobiales bacterium]|jgi:hypothetical protein
MQSGRMIYAAKGHLIAGRQRNIVEHDPIVEMPAAP